MSEILVVIFHAYDITHKNELTATYIYEHHLLLETCYPR